MYMWATQTGLSRVCVCVHVCVCIIIEEEVVNSRGIGGGDMEEIGGGRGKDGNYVDIVLTDGLLKKYK